MSGFESVLWLTSDVCMSRRFTLQVMVSMSGFESFLWLTSDVCMSRRFTLQVTTSMDPAGFLVGSVKDASKLPYSLEAGSGLPAERQKKMRYCLQPTLTIMMIKTRGSQG